MNRCFSYSRTQHSYTYVWIDIGTFRWKSHSYSPNVGCFFWCLEKKGKFSQCEKNILRVTVAKSIVCFRDPNKARDVLKHKITKTIPWLEKVSNWSIILISDVSISEIADCITAFWFLVFDTNLSTIVNCGSLKIFPAWKRDKVGTISNVEEPEHKRGRLRGHIWSLVQLQISSWAPALQVKTFSPAHFPTSQVSFTSNVFERNFFSVSLSASATVLPSSFF